MRLTMQDKNELLKAAVKAPDRESLARWIVSIVDAADAAEAISGKADATVSCPPYSVASGNGQRSPVNGTDHRWDPARLSISSSPGVH